MLRKISRIDVFQLALSTALTFGASSAWATGIVENFESYPVGSFPVPTWQDVGTVDPTPPISPLPSGNVVLTTDAFGNPTQAFSTVSALASSAGIFQNVAASSFSTLHADIRVDQYSDKPASTVEDWAMQLTFAQKAINFSVTPQVGLYASSFNQGWRLFFIGADSGSADIDLGVPAPVGEWFSVELSLNALTGGYDATIADTLTGAILTHDTGLLPDWTAADNVFDTVAFFKGDLSVGDTIGDVGVVDNINVTASVPEPPVWLMLIAGMAALMKLRAARGSARHGQLRPNMGAILGAKFGNRPGFYLRVKA
jgi:hypothetical protein